MSRAVQTLQDRTLVEEYVQEIKYRIDPMEYFILSNVQKALELNEPYRSHYLHPKRVTNAAVDDIEGIRQLTGLPDALEIRRQYDAYGTVDYITLCRFCIKHQLTSGPIIPDYFLHEGNSSSISGETVTPQDAKMIRQWWGNQYV